MTRPLAVLAAAAALLAGGCAGVDDAPPHAPVELRAGVLLQAAPAFGLLDVLVGKVDAHDLPDDVFEPLAWSADVSVDAVRREAAGRLPRGAAPLFAFEPVRAKARAARAVAESIETGLIARLDAVGAAVSLLLPETDGAPTPNLPVLLVVGMPEGRASMPVTLDGRRALLLDAWNLGTAAGVPKGGAPLAARDVLGERAARIVAHDLFLHAFGAYAAADPGWRAWPDDPLHGALATFLVEGIAASLALPAEARFDTRGRRSALADSAARRDLRTFELQLRVMLDPDTPADEVERLAWTFVNGPADERWGTRVAAQMANAVDRFGRTGRLREVVRSGPADLVVAYREISGRSGALPSLSPDVPMLLDPFRVQRPVAAPE